MSRRDPLAGRDVDCALAPVTLRVAHARRLLEVLDGEIAWYERIQAETNSTLSPAGRARLTALLETREAFREAAARIGSQDGETIALPPLRIA